MRKRRAGKAGGASALVRGLAFAASFWGSAATAAPLLGPEAQGRIPAGQLEVALLDSAAPGVVERELVLSLDGGKTFPLRLTGEIGPGDRETRWRVPALPTSHAVLALREGGDGFEEEIAAVSAEFVIVQASGVPAEELQFRDGEWRTREADGGNAGLPAPSMGEARPERCEPLNAGSDAFEAPVRALAASLSAGEGLAGSGPITALASGFRPVERVPLFLPRRE